MVFVFITILEKMLIKIRFSNTNKYYNSNFFSYFLYDKLMVIIIMHISMTYCITFFELFFWAYFLTSVKKLLSYGLSKEPTLKVRILVPWTVLPFPKLRSKSKFMKAEIHASIIIYRVFLDWKFSFWWLHPNLFSRRNTLFRNSPFIRNLNLACYLSLIFSLNQSLCF